MISDYTRLTNFTALAGLDSLPSIFDTEFNRVATFSALKAPLLNPTFTGTVVVPSVPATTSLANVASGTGLNSAVQAREIYMHTFPTGTQMVFYQNYAPAGWAQDNTTTALNDALLRTVTVGGGVTGGTTGFVAAPLNITGAHVLTIAEMPAHTHPVVTNAGTGGFLGGGSPATKTWGIGATSSTGGDGSHTHGITWTPKYVDLILCIKD